ncbi:P-loop containing nucleoside triphosphate hydrolase protein, partial [Lepidopterella palustris CBS 459.81]
GPCPREGKGVDHCLHGVPGVGKTSTAETIAEATGRPLLPVTCGDIGETAAEIEEKLEKISTLAHWWGCVLLLDGANVFLATRSWNDMTRNDIVSVFLRVLEYHSGILFLTTNRVGMIDEGFNSRIHISLYYPPFDWTTTKAIWRMSFRRVHDSVDADEKSLLY